MKRCLFPESNSFKPNSRWPDLVNYHYLGLIIISKKPLIGLNISQVNWIKTNINQVNNHFISSYSLSTPLLPYTSVQLPESCFLSQLATTKSHHLALLSSTSNPQPPPSNTLWTSLPPPFSSSKWVNLITNLIDFWIWFLFLLVLIANHAILTRIIDILMY